MKRSRPNPDAGTSQRPASSRRSRQVAPRAPATGNAHSSPMVHPPKWETVSLEQLRQAAGQGDAAAQYGLGLRHANGVGMPKDAIESVKWFRQAAEQKQLQ